MAKGGVIGTPGNSIALQYEIRLSELAAAARHGGPTIERTAASFEMLGELIPQLGIFQRVMKKITDELRAAVYSDVYTSSGKRSGGQGREPLPFFAVAQRQLKKLEDQMKKQEDEIASLKEQLYTCEAELEKVNTDAEVLRHSLRDRDNKMHELGAELRACAAECDRLKKAASQHQRTDERLKREADYHAHALQNTIQALNEEKSELLKYKNTHTALQDVLAKAKHSSLSTEKMGPSATHKGQLLQHASTAETLKDNLLTLQNTLMDEYDNALNTHIQKHGIEMDKGLKAQQDSFKTSISEVYNELLLLQRHSDMLTTRVMQLDQMECAEPHKVITEHHHPHNPLVAQLQVLNKYAIMIWTSSDGGESFYPLKESQLCTTCGEKVVMCSHMTYPDEVTVHLSGVITHLKISTPLTHIRTPSPKPPQQSILTQAVELVGSGIQTQAILAMPVPNYDIIWLRYRSRFEAERSISRQLGFDKVMVMVHQFYVAVVKEDDMPVAAESDPIPSLLDYLMTWISKRYLLRKVAPMACYNYLLALSKCYMRNIELLVLVWVLCGSLDGAALRFLLLMADLVDKMTWSTVQDLTAWCAVLYPTLQEEGIDQLKMSYAAVCGNNQISKHTVIEFITYLVMKGVEPRIAEMESAVLDHNETGRMIEAEFCELVDMMVPKAPYHQTQRLFMQSLATGKEREGKECLSVSSRNLAYIISYLMLQQEATALQGKVEQLAKATSPSTTATPTPLFTMTMARSMLIKR